MGKAPVAVDGMEDHYFRLNRAVDRTAADESDLEGQIERAAAKIRDIRDRIPTH